MRCERYWDEGVLLVEQGRPDPHRDDCLDCRREHEARGELVRAFKLVGARGGDPHWQARVWKGLERRETTRPGWLTWGPALAAAAMLIVLVRSQGIGTSEHSDPALDEDRPRFEIVRTELAMRSTSASIGERVRIWVDPAQEVRLYRGQKLVLRCDVTTAAPAGTAAGCVRDGGGMIAEHVFTLPGEYQLVVAPAGTLPPPSADGAESLDRDLAAITAAGGTFARREIPVR